MVCLDIQCETYRFIYVHMWILPHTTPLGTPRMTSLQRSIYLSNISKPYKRRLVHGGEYRAQATAKAPNHSICCWGKTVLENHSPFYTRPKYCRTIKKQERQPDKLPFAEQDAHANGLKIDIQEAKGFFYYDPLNELFAKTLRTSPLTGIEPWCSGIVTLAIYPCAKQTLNFFNNFTDSNSF